MWYLLKAAILINKRNNLPVTLGFNFIVFLLGEICQPSFSCKCFVIISLYEIFLLKEPVQNHLTCAYRRSFSQIPSAPLTIFYYEGHSGAITTCLKSTYVGVSLSPFFYRTISVTGKLKHFNYDSRNLVQPWNLGQCI